MLAPITTILCRQCGIDEPDAQDLYLRLLYQAPGLWNHYHCAELTREAMRAAGLPEVKGDFAAAYTNFVESSLNSAHR